MGDVHKLIAQLISGKHMKGSESLRQNIEKCRGKRPKLLLALIDSIVAKDQARFAEALKLSLAHFSKTFPRSNVGGDLVSLIGLPQSILYSWAMHRGFDEVELAPKVAGHLMTRKSLGLKD